MQTKVSEIAAVGIFSAMAFAGGYLLITIPNVEIFTVIVFLSGVFLGSRNGAMVGVIAQVLYSFLNPYGMSPLPLLVAQVANRAITGYVGGYFARPLSNSVINWILVLKLSLTGLCLAWFYDLMAFLSYAVLSGFSMQQMQVSFVLGIPFYLLHGIGNAVIFALLVPLVVKTTSGIVKQRIGS